MFGISIEYPNNTFFQGFQGGEGPGHRDVRPLWEGDILTKLQQLDNAS